MSQQGPNPTVAPFRVGCSGLQIYQWIPSSQYPFTGQSSVLVAGIMNLDVDFKSTSAAIKGGETRRRIATYETDLEIDCKFAVAGHDYRLFLDMINGKLIVDAAGANPEEQYFRTNKTDRSNYFTLVGISTNGDPEEVFVAAKCKYTGFTRNLQRDKETMAEVSFTLNIDDTYINQDGTIGGDFEFAFANGAAPIRPS